MHCLRLFIVVLQELPCVPNCFYVAITLPSFVTLHLLVSEIGKCIA